MTVTVRPAHTAELPVVGDITAAAYAADGLLVEDDPYVAHLRDAATRAREAELYVGLLDDQVAGTVTFCPEGSPWSEIAQPGEGEFRMLAVAPAARGAGIGGSLLDLVVEHFRREGASRVVMSTLPRMRSAHRIYERAGFVRLPERDWSPAEGIDLITYVLELSRA